MADELTTTQRLRGWRGERVAIASAVRARVGRRYPDRAARAAAIAEVVADLDAGRGEGTRGADDHGAWRALVARAPDPDADPAVFDAIVGRYLADIAGGFDRTIYRAVISALPVLLGLAFQPGVAGLRGLGGRLEIDGPMARLRELARTRTLVFAPTHSSNLDSLVLGVALARGGLPPSVYAAGKHMYRHPVVATLMGNLGAYRVDRALTASLYRDVLKAYATELLERGFHSVIFPGATRCRTNEVESQLKLGLLGTTARARRPVLVVPVTINYQVVVEAETLIRYHLDGRAAERIVGDRRAGGLGKMLRRLISLDEVVAVRFAEPLDPTGDLAGSSGDPSGRPFGGATAPDDPTRRLGEAIVRAYRRNTILFATHLTARAIYDEVQRRTGTDIHGLVGHAPGTLAAASAKVHAAVATLVEQLRALPEHGAVHHALVAQPPAAIVATALAAWTAGHPRSVVQRRGDQLVVDDVSLVYFYRNRTHHLG